MKNILISIPSYTGTIPLKVMSRIIALDKPEGYNINFMYAERCFIDKARNAMLKKAIIHDNDFLFFTDSDQIPDKNILVEMVKLDKDIVGCPIASRKGKLELNVYDLEGGRLNEVEESMEIGAIGMGGTMIKRHVLEDMLAEYPRPFEFEYIDGIEYSEDINFCKRAKRLGFEVWAIDPSIVGSVHIGDPMEYYYNGEYKCMKTT